MWPGGGMRHVSHRDVGTAALLEVRTCDGIRTPSDSSWCLPELGGDDTSRVRAGWWETVQTDPTRTGWKRLRSEVLLLGLVASCAVSVSADHGLASGLSWVQQDGGDPAHFVLTRGDASIRAFAGALSVRFPERRGASTRLEAVRVGFPGAFPVSPMATGIAREVQRFRDDATKPGDSTVLLFDEIAYVGLLDGIDLLLEATPSGLKMTWEVAPGARWEQIAVRYEGADTFRIDEEGCLRIATAAGEVVDSAPVIYQEVGGNRIPVEGRFRLVDGETCGFEITGSYDPSRPLVIDPDLSWSTYLGGNDLDAAYDVAVDGEGNAYVVGNTYSSDFPGVTGGRAWRIFISKFSPSGELLWSAFPDLPESTALKIAIDGPGNLHVWGGTSCENLPTLNAWDDTYNGETDVFVAKLDPNAQVLWSTYLGGTGREVADQVSGGIAVDRWGNVYVAGTTASDDFPTPNGWDSTYNTDPGAVVRDNWLDGFVAKFSSSGALLWSTYLGGGYEDRGADIAVDASGCPYVTGWTVSHDFPVPNGWDTSRDSHRDAFVAKFSADGSDLLWSTFLGGDREDIALCIGVDDPRGVYVAGSTASLDFPTPNGWDTTKVCYWEGSVFAAKFDLDGSDLLWATHLGDCANASAYGLAVDASGSLHLAGTAKGGLPTPNGWGSAPNAWSDVFASRFSADGSQLLWSTYVVGSHMDQCYGMALSGSGDVLIPVQTYSDDFRTHLAWDDSYNGGITDGAVLRLGRYSSSVSVSDVTAAQRTDGSMIVDVVYDLRGQIGTTYDVAVQYSPDGVEGWRGATLAAGDVGSDVAAGSGKRVWIDAAGQHAGVRWDKCRVRVLADTAAVSNPFTWDTLGAPGDITVRGSLDLLIKLAEYPERIIAYAQANEDIVKDLANPFLPNSEKKQKVETLIEDFPRLDVTAVDVRDFRQFIRNSMSEGVTITLVPSGADIQVTVGDQEPYVIRDASLGFDRLMLSMESGQCELTCEKNGRELGWILEPFLEVYTAFQAMGVTAVSEVLDPLHVRTELSMFFESPSLSPGVRVETEITDLGGYDVILTSSTPQSARDMSVKVGVGVGLDVEGHAVVGGGASLDVSTYAEGDIRDVDPSNLAQAFSEHFVQETGATVGDVLKDSVSILVETSWEALKCSRLGAGFGLAGEGGIGVGGKAGGGASASADLSVGVSAGFTTPVSVIPQLQDDYEEFAVFLAATAGLTHNLSSTVTDLIPAGRTRERGLPFVDGATEVLDSLQKDFDHSLDELWDDVNDEWEEVVDDVYALKLLLGDFWTCFVRARQLIQDLDLAILNETEVGVGFGLGVSGEAEAVAGAGAEIQIGLRAATNLKSLLLFFSLSGFPEMGLVAAFVDTTIGVNVTAVEATYGRGKDVFGVEVREHVSDAGSGGHEDALLKRVRTSVDAFLDESNEAVDVLGNFSDSGTDTDGDGLFDMLTAEMDIRIVEGGQYTLTGLLFADRTCVATDIRRDPYYEVGDYRVAFDFDAAHFRNRSTSARYDFGYAVTGLDTIIIEAADAPYRTAAYAAADFDGPEAILAGLFSGMGVDLDGDGLSNCLRFFVEVEADCEQNTTFRGCLEGGQDLRVPSLVPLHLEKGTTAAVLDFPGEVIRASGVDVPWTLSFQLLDAAGIPLDKATGLEVYGFDYRDFQKPKAFLTDDYAVRLEDDDGDHLYNRLVVLVGVEVTQPGWYVIDAYLDGEPEGTFLACEGTWGEGFHELPLALDTLPLRLAGETQSYDLVHLRLRDSEDNALGSRVHAFTTPVYEHTVFDPPKARLSGTYSHYTTDANANGLHDALVLSIEVEVTDPAVYAVSGCLNCEGNLIAVCGHAELDPGIQRVELVVDGPWIHATGASGFYCLEGVSVAQGESILGYADCGPSLPFYSYKSFEHYPASDSWATY